MHFFLYEIVARIIAAYLCFDCGRKLRKGFVEREIGIYNSDLLNWWSYPPVHRDAAPVRYWMQMGIQMIGLVACFVVAIFGWFQPNG